MIRTYRVTSTFAAKQLYREPVHYGIFHQGDILVGLRTMGDQIEFCRRDKPTDELGKLDYTVTNAEFLRDTEEHRLA